MTIAHISTQPCAPFQPLSVALAGAGGCFSGIRIILGGPAAMGTAWASGGSRGFRFEGFRSWPA